MALRVRRNQKDPLVGIEFAQRRVLEEVFAQRILGRADIVDMTVAGRIKGGHGLRQGLVPVSYTHLDVYKRQTQDPLREHFFKHPVLGDLDAYQWILLISAHTERHVNQILEVKASPGFPKQ